MACSDLLHDALKQAALDIRQRAYAPYSRFQVGAAVMDQAGEIHVGTNVENAAYPCGVCAETSAIAAMIAARGTRIVAIAVAGPDGVRCPPCGGCRQRIREFATAATVILVRAAGGEWEAFTPDGLLPASFGPETLDRDP